MTFQIVIAGVSIRIKSIYSDVYAYCKDYLDNENEPEISIEIYPSDLEEEALRNKELWPMSDERASYMEILAVYRRIAEMLLKRNIFLMHGVLLDCCGSGILITAPSGTGKTTRANLWTAHIPDSYVINGDKPLLSMGDDVVGYGTPWNGKEYMGCNKSVPVKAICLLERSDEDQMIRVNPREVLQPLMKQVFLPANSNLRIKTLCLLDCLCKKVPVYLMRCDREPSSIIKIYNTLCSDGIIKTGPRTWH